MNLKGKGFWAYFWNDKVKSKFKKLFTKSNLLTLIRLGQIICIITLYYLIIKIGLKN
jgi:hypothetical protein